MSLLPTLYENTIVLENSMMVDSNLLYWLKRNNIIPTKTFNGLTWADNNKKEELIKYILSGEKKHITLATSFTDPEYLEYMFEQLHTNTKAVSIIIYEQADEIIKTYQTKYPNIKFQLLTYDDLEVKE